MASNYLNFISDASNNYISDASDNRIVLPSLQEAYNTLMSDRDDNLYINPSEGGLTEDDILCNTSLRTARLFKSYSEELKKLQDEYRILKNDEEQIQDSTKSFHSSMHTIRVQTQRHHAASTDSLEGTSLIMNRSVSNIILAIMNEIDLKKSNLDAKIDKVTKKLSALRVLIQTGLDDMVGKDAANKKLCTICFDREIDLVMVPCGHTSCSGCSNYNKPSKCMHCRSIIHQRVKIYFS